MRESSLRKAVLAFLVIFFPVLVALQAASSPSDEPKRLEVVVTAPLRWENGCLYLSLDRINHGSTPLFIPLKGLYIFTSVTELPDKTGRKNGVEWINIYGASDIGNWDAEPIAPDETIHSEYCLGPTIPVVSLERETWRKIPVRGRLRIDAYYFSTKEDWLTNKTQHEEMPRSSDDELKRMKVVYPHADTVFSRIPCSDESCPLGCAGPPAVLYGENRVIPDVYAYDEKSVARGRLVDEELARRSRPCTASKPNSP